MAVTASLLTNANNNPGSGTNFATASVSPSANKLLLLFIGSSAQNNGDNSAPTSVTGFNYSFTKIGDYVSETGWERQTVWCAISASPIAGVIDIIFSDSQSQVAHTLIELTGAGGTVGDNGVSGVVQIQGVTNGGDNPTPTSTASLAAFASASNATLMYWNAATADGIPVTTTASAGLTELLDFHQNTGLGWDVHLSMYFQDTPKTNGVVTASSYGSFNAKILISMEVKAATAGTNYSMTAAAGSYTYAGNAAALSFGRRMFAVAGNYAYAGADAGLGFGRKMAAAAGSYAYAGLAAGLGYGRTMLANAGAYAYAGLDAGLGYGRTMLADAGAYIYVGGDADLIYGTPPAGNEPGFQPDAFQSDAYQVGWNEVVVSIWEGADIASFSTTATTFVGFDVLEGPDVAHFSLDVKTYVTFGVTEGPDVFAFDMDVKTYIGFILTEGPDIPDFSVLTGAMLEFDLIEGPDVPQFRTFTTWWDEGDAFYMYVPYEIQEITLTADLGSYILVPAEYRVMTVQSEWKRIDVDQQRARRRETT